MRVPDSIVTWGCLLACVLPSATSFSTPLAFSTRAAHPTTRRSFRGAPARRPAVPISLHSATTASAGETLADEPADDKGATISSEILNLVKGIVGAGVLTIPSGIAKMGNTPSTLVPALFLILVIGSLSGYGFSLIGRVCSLTSTTSYRGAWEESVSKESSWIPAVSVTLKTIFAILACTYAYCNTLQRLTHNFFANRFHDIG